MLGQHALKKIAALQPVQYRHIDEDPTLPESVGFIAQDFEKEFPNLIRKRKNDDGVKPIKKPKPPRVPEPGIGVPPISAPTDPIAEQPAPEPVPVEPEPTVPLSVRMKLLADEPIDTTIPVGAAKPEKPGETAAEAQDETETDDGSIQDMQGYSILSFEELIPLLVGSIKELKMQLDESKTKVSELEKKVQKLLPSLT